MANTSSRALRLLSLLQNHRFWPGAELAERLGVSPRTLRRDVDRLRELGYPVTAHPGVDGGYQLASGAALPPLVVDDEEAVALAVGLRLATQGADDPGSHGAGHRRPRHGRGGRRPRAGEGHPGHARPAAPPGRGGGRHDRVRQLGRRARRPRRPPSTRTCSRAPPSPAGTRSASGFAYGAASGERTERHVEPHRLVALDRRWYLVAYDLTRNDWRSFRLDRVIGVPQPTGARFRPRALPAADAAEFVRRNVTAAAGDVAGQAVIEAPAAVVRERIGRWATVEEDGPGRCLVTMTPRGQPRLAGDRARRGGRGLPGAVPAGADRADRRLGHPVHPRGPAACGS